MAGPDPYADLLARLTSPDVGRVGAREMLREVLRRLPLAWDPRVLDATRALTKKFPPLAEEFPVLEQLAGMKVTSVVERALGLEEHVRASIDAADREGAESLFRDLKAERGRAKDERARLFSALGKKLLDLRDRKNGRAALREAQQLATPPLKQEIDAILDDLPGSKGREWRQANGTVLVSGNPSEPPMLNVKGKDAPPRAFVEERLLGAPLLEPCSNPRDTLSFAVTLEHDMERVRTGSIRPRDPGTAPSVGLIARDAKGAPIGVTCGAFASPIERFTNAAEIGRDVTHVAIGPGPSFAQTRLEPKGAPNEGDGWLVIHENRPFVRTRGGCWLRHPGKNGPPPADGRARFQVTRSGLVWIATNVKPVAP